MSNPLLKRLRLAENELNRTLFELAQENLLCEVDVIESRSLSRLHPFLLVTTKVFEQKY